jgi:hypothetical protein
MCAVASAKAEGVYRGVADGRGVSISELARLLRHTGAEGVQRTTRLLRHPELVSLVILNSFQDLTFERRWY